MKDISFFQVKKINDAMFLIIKTWLIYGKWLDKKWRKMQDVNRDKRDENAMEGNEKSAVDML
jgi:hypothetical protein